MNWYEELVLTIIPVLVVIALGCFVVERVLSYRKNHQVDTEPINWSNDWNLLEYEGDDVDYLTMDELKDELRSMIAARDMYRDRAEQAEQKLRDAQVALLHQAALKKRYYNKLKRAGIIKPRTRNAMTRDEVLFTSIPQVPEVSITGPIHFVGVTKSPNDRSD